MFDKIKFSKVLNTINDTYDTMTEFAQKSEVNRTYLSQYINQKLDAPPSPKVLMKIANNSHGLTTYNELMHICGYFIASNNDLDELKHSQSALKYDNLIKNLPLSDAENAVLSSIYSKYDKLRNDNISLEEIKKILISDIQQLSPEQYNINNLIEALKLYILAFSSNVIVNAIYDSHAEIDTKTNFIDAMKKIDSLYKDIFPNSEKKDLPFQKLFKIPVLGKIAAGQPILVDEYLEGYLPIDPLIYGMTTAEDLFYLKVSGQSMNQKVKNGDYALIKKQDYAENGDIIVAIVNGDNEATLKRYKKLNEQFVLLEPMSTDPTIEAITVDLKTTEFKIIGKAIGQFGKF